MRRLLLRLFTFLRHDGAEEDLARELASHLSLLETEYRHRGMSPGDARLAALRAMGGAEQAKELHRDARSFVWLEDLRSDMRHTLRSLRRTPGFAAVAVLTLAAGIGAATAIVSVINGIALRPLPYDGSDRLVRIAERAVPAEPAGGRPAPVTSITRSEMDALRSARTLSHVGVYGGRPLSVTIAGREGPTRLTGERVSAAVLQMLRARPLLGRTFEAEEDAAGNNTVIILSWGAWQRDFDGDPAILGQAVSLDGTGYSVIGVMPRDFRFPDVRTAFWVPFAWPADSRAVASAPSIARVGDGVSMAAATSEVSTMLRRLRGRSADRPDSQVELIRIRDEISEPVRPALRGLAGAAAMVLLIACVNVTSLLLARSTARRREVAVRLALGARRGRVVRLALAESLVIAAAAGLAGTALAWTGVRALRAIGSSLPRTDLYTGTGISLPRLDEVGLDLTVLGFTVAVSALAAGLFGLAPAIREAWSDYAGVLRDGNLAAPGSTFLRGRVAHAALVVGEIALAMMLLACGGLLIHSFVRLSNVDPGYNPAHLAWLQTFPSRERSPADLVPFAETVVARVRSLPGVRAAGYAVQLPTGNALREGALRRTPGAPAPGEPYSRVDLRVVSHGFLGALEARVVAGRGLGPNDAEGAPLVLLVNESVVRSGILGENPIGAHVYAAGDAPWEVVGIVEDLYQFGLDREPGLQAFVDYRQLPSRSLNGLYLAVRTDDDRAPVASAVRRVVRDLDARATLEPVATMEQLLANTMSRPRLYALLAGIFAAMAVSLASVGLYGLVAYTVAQRTREIGLRMALGAERARILGMMARQGLALAVIGIALGTAGAAGMTRYLEGMLFGLTPLDPATFIAVVLLFVSVAVLAACVPARRATRVDPLVALRYE